MAVLLKKDQHHLMQAVQKADKKGLGEGGRPVRGFIGLLGYIAGKGKSH